MSSEHGDYQVQFTAGDTATFTVKQDPLIVEVSGVQTVGVGTPLFSYETAQTLADGTSLSGTVNCTTAGGQPTYPASLPVGTYTIDPSSCSGLVGAPSNGYAITYAGGTFTVNPAPTYTPTAAPPAEVGVPWTASFHVSGGTLPYTVDTIPNFAAQSTGMTPTITWDPGTTTETISGTATSSGQALFSLSGQDASGGPFYLIGVPIDVLQLDTTAGPTLTYGDGSMLTASVDVLEQGRFPNGTLTFTLLDPSDDVVSSAQVTAAGNGTYTAPNHQVPGATGTYTWKVSYSTPGGSIDAPPATETVTSSTAPLMTTQPSDLTILAGQTATFTAAASGTPTPTVQWQVSTNGGSTFTNVSGATSTTLSFTALPAQSGNKYRAVFTNTGGNTTSSAATLTVNAPPAVTQQPSNRSVLDGQTASFTAAASGTPTPTVQWQVSTDAGTTFTTSPAPPPPPCRSRPRSPSPATSTVPSSPTRSGAPPRPARR